MKHKILMLLAAVLLCSVSAFAQSGDGEPLKGDVNGDGMVDEADVITVIGIMANGGGIVEQPKYYWYVGTTKPTSLSQATIVDKYESSYTFTNPSTTEKCYVYVLTNADKEVIFKDPAFTYGEASKTEDITTIPGYKITSTAGRLARGGSVLVCVLDDGWKHFYVGTTQPTAENYETLTPQFSSLSDMNGATVHVPASGKVYVMLPYQDSPNQSRMKRAFIDGEGNVVTCIERTGDAQTIPFHMIWELTYEPGTTLTFKEPVIYYFYVGTTKPTSLSDAWSVGAYEAEQSYTNNSGADDKVYVLTNSDKNVTFIDPYTGETLDQDDVDTTTISGYKIFATYTKILSGWGVDIRIE